jgi:hypothetical protein
MPSGEVVLAAADVVRPMLAPALPVPSAALASALTASASAVTTAGVTPRADLPTCALYSLAQPSM